MKKSSILLVLFCISLSTFGQFRMSDGTMKVATTMTIIENLYVDPIDDEKLSADAVRAILEKLDPHSTYINAEEADDANDPLEGNFDGIGISFNMLTDTVYVIETIAGGPAEKVGMRAGDRIISANDTIIAGINMSTKKVMSHLKGPKGTKVNIKVLRKGEKELLNFRIVRDKIPYHSLDAAYMIDKEVGYIRLSRFGATTTEETRQALKKLLALGMQSLILDLEYNGGGYLSAAAELADEFLDKDKLIVYTEGHRQAKFSEKSTNKGLFEKGKLVLLINEYSASASEIVSGAIQDWDRGVIIGRRSFGKGLVQRQFPLPDNSLIRLTVARYYTPTGRSIQKPYTSGDIDSYARDFLDRYNRGEMVSADSIHFPDSVKYETLINKRTVYGSGGIMPDYFVAMDTTVYTSYWRDIRAKSIVHKIAYNEVDNHRAEILAEYPNSKAYYEKYMVSDDMLKRIIEEGEKEDVKFDEKEYLIAKPLFQNELKALLARDLYDMETQYKIINDQNDIYKKAYEIIKNNKQYNELIGKP